MLDALERTAAGRRAGRSPDGGYFTWLELPEGTTPARSASAPRASPSCSAPTSAARRTRSVSPTASSRPPRSTRGRRLRAPRRRRDRSALRGARTYAAEAASGRATSRGCRGGSSDAGRRHGTSGTAARARARRARGGGSSSLRRWAAVWSSTRARDCSEVGVERLPVRRVHARSDPTTRRPSIKGLPERNTRSFRPIRRSANSLVDQRACGQGCQGLQRLLKTLHRDDAQPVRVLAGIRRSSPPPERGKRPHPPGARRSFSA